MTSQLTKLAKPIPEAYVKVKPTGRGDRYVSHGDITQFLLAHVGPFDMRVVELIRSPEGIVEGCILEATFQIDGRTVTIQEIGEVERPSKHSGQNAKSSVSDGIKRIAMRCSLGLSLWTGDESYRLHKELTKGEE
tara:strand:+ start:820 stop:1224 length:405 start_codon:yes stop_codon:yes gene_type:complete